MGAAYGRVFRVNEIGAELADADPKRYCPGCVRMGECPRHSAAAAGSSSSSSGSSASTSGASRLARTGKATQRQR